MIKFYNVNVLFYFQSPTLNTEPIFMCSYTVLHKLSISTDPNSHLHNLLRHMPLFNTIYFNSSKHTLYQKPTHKAYFNSHHLQDDLALRRIPPKVATTEGRASLAAIGELQVELRASARI